MFWHTRGREYTHFVWSLRLKNTTNYILWLVLLWDVSLSCRPLCTLYGVLIQTMIPITRYTLDVRGTICHFRILSWSIVLRTRSRCLMKEESLHNCDSECVINLFVKILFIWSQVLCIDKLSDEEGILTTNVGKGFIWLDP